MGRAQALRSAARRLWQRHLRLSDPFWFAVMCVLALVVIFIHARFPQVATPSLLIVILLFGGLFLSVRALAYLVVVVAAGLIVMAFQGGILVGQVLGVGLSSVLVMWWVRFRSRLGLRGTTSDLLLVDLRDQLVSHGQIPTLPRGWNVEAEIRPAHGSTFSGDFAVTHFDTNRQILDLVIVDVSGKGPAAAARALVLQGAMGGLLGATSFGDFFPATNQFLLRQSWIDGFATAAHVRIELMSGRFRVTLAGHPPVGRFSFGSSHWTTLGEPGPMLGISENVEFHTVSDRLEVGDALLLYTDGVVEVSGRDLLFGIDKFLGEAERHVSKSWRSLPKHLIDIVAESQSDDRAVILVRRLPRHVYASPN